MEIGPRFVLNLIKMFQGSFGGPTLYENPHFQSPNMVSCFQCLSCLRTHTHCIDLFYSVVQHRRMIRQAMGAKQKEKQLVKETHKEKQQEEQNVVMPDVTDDVFVTSAQQKPPRSEREAPERQMTKKRLKLTELKKKMLMKRKGLR